MLLKQLIHFYTLSSFIAVTSGYILYSSIIFNRFRYSIKQQKHDAMHFEFGLIVYLDHVKLI